MDWRDRRADLVALLVTCAIGLPLVYLGAAAYAEGEVRRRQTPLRALLGPGPFEALSRGAPSEQHYLGTLPGARASATRDRRAPDFTLESSEGGSWRLSDHRGKVIVMNFWTVTCQPCVEEMPSLTSLARMLDGRDDIELVTVSVDEDWDTVRTVVPDDSPMLVLLDPDRQVVRDRFGSRLFPETWIIDPDGVIRLRVDGRRNWSDAIVLDVLESYL